MPNVSVIIVNYNVKYYVEQCINSVLRSVPLAQVIVVDNNSNDGSVEYIRTRFPSVQVIANAFNAGFGRANNMALEMVDSEYVLFLNPDTVVAERTIPECMEYMEAHPHIGAVGVRMQYGNGRFALESRRSLPTPQVSFFHMIGLGKVFPKSKLFAKYHLTYMDAAQECGIDVVSGAYMFVRREALAQSGGFDEDFFMYGEDIDLSYRIMKAGYRNAYLPVPIVHYKGESTNKTSYRYAKVFYDAMIIFYSKHFTDYNSLFTHIVKAAVSVRKVMTFVSQNIRARRRMIADYQENALYVGRSETFAQVEQLVGQSKMLRNLQLVEGHDELLFYADKLNGVGAVLFDVDAFTYNTILDWMYAQAACGKHYTMGLYSSSTGKLITEDETL